MFLAIGHPDQPPQTSNDQFGDLLRQNSDPYTQFGNLPKLCLRKLVEARQIYLVHPFSLQIPQHHQKNR